MPDWLLWTLLPLAAIISARLLWQRRPSVLTCALFWSTALVVVGIGWTWAPSNFLFVAGVACNAAVTLANGGFMPVAGHRRLAGPARSVWVQRENAKHLLFLGDNWGNRYIRFSIGDTLLLAGILLTLAGV